MIYSLFQERQLPEEWTYMCCTDQGWAWIAEATISSHADLEHEIGAGRSFVPSIRVHGLEVQHQIALANKRGAAELTLLCQAKSGSRRLHERIHIAIQQNLSEIGWYCKFVWGAHWVKKSTLTSGDMLPQG